MAYSQLCRQTNNVAEIQAGIVAIRQAVAARRSKLVIHTDSQFLISCVTQWMQGWKVRTKVREGEGWKLGYRGKYPPLKQCDLTSLLSRRKAG